MTHTPLTYNTVILSTLFLIPSSLSTRSNVLLLWCLFQLPYTVVVFLSLLHSVFPLLHYYAVLLLFSLCCFALFRFARTSSVVARCSFLSLSFGDSIFWHVFIGIRVWFPFKALLPLWLYCEDLLPGHHNIIEQGFPRYEPMIRTRAFTPSKWTNCYHDRQWLRDHWSILEELFHTGERSAFTQGISPTPIRYSIRKGVVW